MTRIQSVRQKIIDRGYYLSSHAEEEMLDDELARDDVENAYSKGGSRRNYWKTHGGRGIASRGLRKMGG